ncbi:nucleotidyltransferase domain-containing protein [Pseudarthrobacter sp. SORGH_AS 212]|uniref:nucleotidyltransferase domain-containing protein n=1 Tax=Pseudarthrobacter sp. SORGH_AS 212 TaxID=3041777 RepID=UPI0032B7DA79
MSHAMAVLMYGSWSKGRADVHSDLDLIVVLDRRPTQSLRAELTDATASVPLRVDLLLWTEDDIVAAHDDPFGFRGSVLSSAVPLHVRPDAVPLVTRPSALIGPLDG